MIRSLSMRETVIVISTVAAVLIFRLLFLNSAEGALQPCDVELPSSGGTHSHTTLPMRPSQSSVKVPSMGAGEAKVWVVVTTVNAPTPSVEALVALTVSDKGSFGLVVVGDTKSVARDAYLAAIPTCVPENDCYYLDMKAQEELGLSMYEHIPTRHYARKNIGYAFAVGKGATMVYDTDDDNLVTVPLDETVAKWEKAQAEGLMGVRVAEGVESSVVNPYAHFGRADIWPRGMPLSDIAGNAKQEAEYSRGCSAHPMVLQGLANGDPDVDAIWRLTRSERGKPIRVTFDSSQPSVLVEPHTFAPFNSQNTLFVKDALWALYIPTTTTFRVCDIWRGYWAQRLLWEIGGSLVFGPPTVFQDRNVHDYLLDFIDEEPMYDATQKLITFLDEWRCDSQYDLFECAVQLASGMAEHAFWGAKDALGVAAWLGDLKALGYTPPARVRHAPTPGSVVTWNQPGSLAGDALPSPSTTATEAKTKTTAVLANDDDDDDGETPWNPVVIQDGSVHRKMQEKNLHPDPAHGVAFWATVTDNSLSKCFKQHKLPLTQISTGKRPVPGTYHHPVATWTSSRNILLRSVRRQAQARGAPFKYACLLDGDLEFDCDGLADFVSFLEGANAAIVSPEYEGHGKANLEKGPLSSLSEEERRRVYAVPGISPEEGAFQCFSPVAIDTVLPYSERMADTSWWHAQVSLVYDAILSNLAAVDVVRFLPFSVRHTTSTRTYPDHIDDIVSFVNDTRGGDLGQGCHDILAVYDHEISPAKRDAMPCCLSTKTGDPIHCPAETSVLILDQVRRYMHDP